MNHIAFQTESITDVDETVTFLIAKNIPALFDTPRHRPEFSIGPDDTYYQVMFETSDKLIAPLRATQNDIRDCSGRIKLEL
jgi:hypothetical protein